MAIVSPARDKASVNVDVRSHPARSVVGSEPTSGSLRKRITVSLCAAIAAAGMFAGMGIIGMAINDGARGSFATTQTLLNPARFSFAVWTPIYLGLLAYAAWQLTLRGSSNKRAKGVAKLAALSMLLNAMWILTVQLDLVLLSWLVISSLAVNLGVLLKRLSRTAPRSRAELLLLDGVFGLYLGWVIVSGLANAAIVVHLAGLAGDPSTHQAIATAALLGMGVIAAVVAQRLTVVTPVLMGLFWGTFSIGLARVSEPPYSVPLALVAFAMSFGIVIVWLIRGVREHRAVSAK